jgi:hypothetical protein
MKNMTKTPRSGVKTAVKQIKGPGMNEGLKKPRRKAKQPEDYGKPRKAKGPAFMSSYLPDTLGMGRKKSKP